MTGQNFYLEATKNILEVRGIAEGLRRLDVPPGEFKDKLDDLLKESQPSGTASDSKNLLLTSVSTLAIHAFMEAASAGHDFVTPTDLFTALGTVKDGFIDRLFDLFAIEPGDLKRALILSSVAYEVGRIPRALGGFAPILRRGIRHRVINRAWTSRPTPTLDRYGTDFTDLARESQAGFLVGHAEEYEKLVEALARPVNPNALLVGEAGIGKETIVQHLAFKLDKRRGSSGAF